MTAGDFGEFYQALHGRPPFPWQERLAGTVLADGWDQRVLELPTASGKTSVLDIAVFHLAMEGENADRKSALRILFVVDRRLVVDGAADHAEGIAERIRNASSGILGEVRARLERFGGSSALEVVKLRGGMYRDNAFADRPNQPLICVSTVDQIGSRLLFRGYQVSDRQQSVHAGLAGRDSLLFVDEAHLSQPFVELVAELEKWNGGNVSRPLRMVTMSATAGAEGAAFGLDAQDFACTPLKQRLEARKLAELRSPAKFEEGVVSAAAELGKSASVVGIVVNTVAAAREVFRRLELKAEGRKRVLLTGRVRPFNRDQNLGKYLPAMMAGRESDLPLYVVATQTVEVGADLDFDALVTEAAPLDALRQRFGRLDRLGRRGETKAVVVYRKADAVYGEPREATWGWLNEIAANGVVDFGPTAMEKAWRQKRDSGLLSRREHMPLLFGSQVETWIQTNPAPHPEADLAPFLHGPSALNAADVQVVWRNDLPAGSPSEWKEVVSLAPPVMGEALALPFRAARAWLAKLQDEEISDLEGAGGGDEADLRRAEGRVALRWLGPDHERTGEIVANGLRPGDTIVVPSEYGGCDEWGWLAESGPVEDVGNRAGWIAYLARKRRGALRWRIAVGRTEDGEADLESGVPQDMAAEVPKLFEREPTLYGEDQRAVFEMQGWEETDEDDSASYVGAPIGLTAHLSAVEQRAETFARLCGLSAELVSDVRLAAKFHDIGKCDARFQLMLRLAGRSGKGLLAKSGGRSSWRERKAARQRAGYPERARHEFASVALLESSDFLAEAHDRELVLHLVGTHHGLGRALAPVWVEEEELELEYEGVRSGTGQAMADLGSGWVERFWRLNAQYGYWGLAYLEAILRRADCVVSREEGA